MTTDTSRRNVSRRRLLGAAVGVVVCALGAKGVASLAARGLPPPIVSETEGVARLPSPEPTGSSAETAEVEELLAHQSQRDAKHAEEATFWQAGAVLRWNEIARGLVSKYGTSPVVASRVFALLSVAQHDALLAVLREQRLHKRPAPSRVTPLFAAPMASSYPSEHAAIAAASAAVLSRVYASKEQVESIKKRAADHRDSRMWAGVSRRSDLVAGEKLGGDVGERVMSFAKSDGADRAGVNWQGTIPVGKDKWASSEHPPVVPLRPRWGTVRPWLMKTSDQFRPSPPPDIDSPEFAKAIDEVREISRTRTQQQLEIASFWADSPGSPTPAGHWNKVAAEAIAEQRASEFTAARIMAVMNMAVMDAGIACWEAKYHYWYLRPSHADPTITLPVGLPNFPAYPSGHSTFSGAAAEILSFFYPSQRLRLEAMAEEASMSRIYGGIHYRFEGVKGIELGRKIGRLAADKAKSEGMM